MKQYRNTRFLTQKRSNYTEIPCSYKNGCCCGDSVAKWWYGCNRSQQFNFFSSRDLDNSLLSIHLSYNTGNVSKAKCQKHNVQRIAAVRDVKYLWVFPLFISAFRKIVLL